MRKVLFLSIKPEFANKIINGDKTIELRKVKPKVNNGDYVLIYSTSPVKAIIAIGKVKDIFFDKPKIIWSKYKKQLGIDKVRYNSYFENKELAVAIKLKEIQELDELYRLEKIKLKNPEFHPPQSYMYFSWFKAVELFDNLNNLRFSFD